jgi:hypothetical protein
MRRRSFPKVLVWAVLLAVGAVVGCDSPSDEHADAGQKQKEAEQKAVELKGELDKKIDEVEKKAAEMEKKATDELDAAVAKARDKAPEAKAALAKARASAAKALEEFDTDTKDLRAKLEKKLTRAEADKVMKDLKDKAEAVRTSLRELDDSPEDKWEAAKKAVTQRVEELGRALEKAKKRL